MRVNPYLNFGGRCAEAIAFYQAILAPQSVMAIPFRGSPGEEQVPETWRDKIMHASLQIGPTLLMGSDGMPGGQKPIQGCTICLGCDSDDDAKRVFAALLEHGSVTMPLQETFWTSQFGMLTDQFGVAWMVMTDGDH